jgi:hypothetical protein
MSRKFPNDRFIQARIPRDVHGAVHRLAKQQDLQVSQWLRRLVIAALEHAQAGNEQN